MNIFVTDDCPVQSARNLPDKHIVKMPLETCQMLAIIYSDWYYGIGKLYKSDGTPYRTAHGAFRNHPCTRWAAANQYNLAWLIRHGFALCDEYQMRYNKTHTCEDVIVQAVRIYNRCFDETVRTAYYKVGLFTRAMPDYLKYDTTITTIQAYKAYLNTKPWLATNYLRIPSRKPSFITTMTTVKSTDINYNNNELDLSTGLSETEEIKRAIEQAESAMAAPAAARPLAPAKKAAKRGGKAGRIVGISKDENEFLIKVLQMLPQHADFSAILEESKAAYDKLVARYNK